MKKVIWMMVILILCISSRSPAITLTLDGNLTEWVGPSINVFSTEPAPEGGTYTPMATWDGTNLYLGIDRASSGRYLADTYWNNDSFYIAIDVDGVDGSGAPFAFFNNPASPMGYVAFNGPKLPDIMYFYEGGRSWYKVAFWYSPSWSETWPTMGTWQQTGAYYGYQPANPNDELIVDLVARASDIGLTVNPNELSVWMWMSREQSGFIEAAWPHRGNSFLGNVFAEPTKIRDEATRLFMPHDPNPALIAQNIDGDAPITLSWKVAQNSGGVVDPNLSKYKLYMSDAYPGMFNNGEPDNNTVPTLNYVKDVTTWTAGTASTALSAPLAKNSTYFWRVDTVKTDLSEVTGDEWQFFTELSIPVITTQPRLQLVDAGATATFTVVVSSASTPTYQWYKRVGDVNTAVGTSSDTLTINNAQVADEARYFCVVTNASPGSATSVRVPLAIKAKLAGWSFEGNITNSVAGCPASTLAGSATYVTGVDGNAIQFSVDPCGFVYTDPCSASYWDNKITNGGLTVGCWVKIAAANAISWNPFVARYGESGAGWQLRNHYAAGRPCFTTRGTANDDGDAYYASIADANWHYVVGTWDGSVKKLYVDGVARRYYSADTGSFISDGQTATGSLGATTAPVSIGAKAWLEIAGLTYGSFSPGAYDEAEIYNYALDAETIAQTYANVTGKSVCPAPPAYDLDGDCIVNFNDFAKLASEWLVDGNVKP